MTQNSLFDTFVTTNGYHASITAVHDGISRSHFCGYLAIPEGHPWHAVGYDNIGARVHGGLTYASGAPASFHGRSMPASSSVIGFDCAHAGDTIYICTPAYVREQLESLAKQAEAAVK